MEIVERLETSKLKFQTTIDPLKSNDKTSEVTDMINLSIENLTKKRRIQICNNRKFKTRIEALQNEMDKSLQMYQKKGL